MRLEYRNGSKVGRHKTCIHSIDTWTDHVHAHPDGPRCSILSIPARSSSNQSCVTPALQLMQLATLNQEQSGTVLDGQFSTHPMGRGRQALHVTTHSRWFMLPLYTSSRAAITETITSQGFLTLEIHHMHMHHLRRYYFDGWSSSEHSVSCSHLRFLNDCVLTRAFWQMRPSVIRPSVGTHRQLPPRW